MKDVKILEMLRSLVLDKMLLGDHAVPCLNYPVLCLNYLNREINRLSRVAEKPKLDGPELLAELEHLHGKAEKRIESLQIQSDDSAKRELSLRENLRKVRAECDKRMASLENGRARSDNNWLSLGSKLKKLRSDFEDHEHPAGSGRTGKWIR